MGEGKVGGGAEVMGAMEGGEDAREVAREKVGKGGGNAGGEALEGVVGTASYHSLASRSARTHHD